MVGGLLIEYPNCITQARSGICSAHSAVFRAQRPPAFWPVGPYGIPATRASIRCRSGIHDPSRVERRRPARHRTIRPPRSSPSAVKAGTASL